MRALEACWPSSERVIATPPQRRALGPWLQLAPTLLYFAVVFIGPLILLVAYSLFTFRDFQYVPELTTRNYVEILTSPAFRLIFARTAAIALVVTLVVLLVAYPFVYIVTFVLPQRGQTVYFLVLVTLFGSYLARIYAWRTILGSEGVINSSLMGLGAIDEPLKFLLNSPFAVVIALTNFLIPLAVLPIYSAMQNVSPGLLEAGRDLGGGRMQVLRGIVLPLTLPGVRVAAAFTFIAAASDYATPTLLGGPIGRMAGGAIVQEFSSTLDWPLGAALAMTLVVLLVIMVGLLSLVVGWLAR